MKLEGQRSPAITHVTESQVKNQILALRSYGPCSYASLTDDAGNYIQVAGGGVTCMVERFEATTGTRLRAFHGKPNPIYPDGTILAFGAGELSMKSDEWFMSDAVIELFLGFLQCGPYPEQVCWRSAPGF